MPSPTALTIYLFGLTAFSAGVYNLIYGPATTTPEMTANSLAALAMGIYYPLAAYQENRAFFLATVPMRCLSATVFWQQDWRAAAVWEGGGAALTGLAIGWERWWAGAVGGKSHVL